MSCRSSRRLAFACLLSLQFGTPAPAVDAATKPDAGGSWPQFRGPHRDGHSPVTNLLATWPEGGPAVKWRVPAGPGYSGVAITGDTAITQWQHEDSQQLVALDVATGAQKWRVTTGPAYHSQYGDGPRATPLIDDGRAFAIDANGKLVAVRLTDGKPIWSRDLVTELDARIPAIGYAASPLLDSGRLMVETGSTGGGFAALDAATGKVVWTAHPEAAAYSSPIAIEVHGKRQILFFSAGGVRALAPQDGRLYWEYPWSSPCPASGIPLNSASPLFVPPDRVFLSSAYGDHRGGGVLRIVPGKSKGEPPLRVERVWHETAIDSRIGTAVLVDDHIYGFKNAVLVCVDAATGEMKWQASGFGRGSVIHADGKLVVLSESGRLVLIEASPAGYEELARAQVLDGRTWTAPALAGGTLFVRNQAEVVAIDLRPAATPARPADPVR